MKYLNSNATIVGLFFAGASLLVIYLLSIRWYINLPITLFWVAVTLMVGTITYQSLKIELSPSYAKVVLLEIVVTNFVFHLIYQIPYYGLNGYDPYMDMAVAKGILSSGFVPHDINYLAVNLNSHFPMIHIHGAISSMISGIDLFSVANWFPSLIDTAIIPLLYLLVRNVFKEEKVALISALLFACLQNHIAFGSAFIRETIALVLAVCCLYLYFSAKHSLHPRTNYALSIVCLMGTVFAHHLTSFMLLVFLSTHFLLTKAAEVPYFRRAYFGNNITGEKVTIAFLSVAFAATLSYWTFVVIYPLNTLTTFVRSVFTPSQWGVESYSAGSDISATSIQTVRGHIIFYGFYFFTLIFGLILLYASLTRARAKKRRVESYSFTLFLFLCGVVGFLSLYLVAAAPFPDRFLTYGWLFGFVPLVMAILKGNRVWLKRAGILLLIAFMLFNIYMIDTTGWNAGGVEVTVSPTVEDYALANTFNFSQGKIFGYQACVLAIFDVYNNLGTGFSSSKEVNLAQFDWVIINKEALELEKTYYPTPRTKTIAVLEHLAFGDSVGYNKIYESDNLVVVVKAHAGS